MAGDDLIWRDGTRLPLGPAHPDASFEELQRDGSILDQLRVSYPHDDAGRIRNRAFFDKMYGDCRRGEVTPHLVGVVWLPQTWGHVVRITTINGVAAQLDAVSRELDALPAEVKRALYPIGGTYVCRAVADSGQPSMHGWGAAIDINVAQADYWLWHRPGTPLHRPIAPEIVASFERHGFIWGGRWEHYDTMHFEYRPDLLEPTH